jgi:uncharacterized protein (DUF1697 family)
LKKGEALAVYVLLLRGVNVGGSGRLPMADLRALLARLGCEAVATYIQSGNAVFRFDRDVTALAAAIGEGIAAAFGFRPVVLLREAGQLAEVLAVNPFAVGLKDAKTVHVFHLSCPAPHADLAALRALAAPGEAFHLTEAAFYLFAPEGIGRSVLATRVERALGVPLTARNLRTTMALAAMAQALAATEAPC